MQRILIAALAALTLTTTAYAGPWTGCYGGGAAGYQSALSDTSITDGVDTITVDSLGAQGGSLTALAGCDLQVERFVFGVWADHTWSDAGFTVGISGPTAVAMGIAGTALQTAVDTSWAIGGRAGYVFVPGALAYVLAGYSQAELDDITFPSLAPGFALSVPTLDGYVLGGGAEISMGRGLYLQAQYTYADYDQADIALGGGVSLGLDVDVQTARVGLLYRFSAGDPVIPVIDAPLAAPKPLK
jgi:outer membrane immunogenic protein